METKLKVHVQPGARSSEVAGFRGDELLVRVAAPPQEGRANQALVKLLAERLDVAPSRVWILRGHSSRHKLVVIEGLGPDAVRSRVNPAPPSHGHVKQGTV